MPRAENQKARMLALYIIFLYHSDENHGLTIAQILKILKEDYEIDSTAQTVTSDFWLMDILFNITIESDNHRPKNYFMTNMPLTTLDISRLMNCVMESQNTFVVTKQKLEAKLKKLANKYSSGIFAHQKAALEIDAKTALKLETLRDAIQMHAQIKFNYPMYEFGKQAKISPAEIHNVRSNKTVAYFPLDIYYANNTPYLCVCKTTRTVFFTSEKIEREYYSLNVKFMNGIQQVEGNVSVPFPADYGPETTQDIKYMPQIKGKDPERVTLEIDDYLVDYVIEYFGENVEIEERSEGKYRVIAETYVTSEFLGWVFSMGTGAKLLTPLHATNRMKQWVKSLSELYGLAESHTTE